MRFYFGVVQPSVIGMSEEREAVRDDQITTVGVLACVRYIPFDKVDAFSSSRGSQCAISARVIHFSC